MRPFYFSLTICATVWCAGCTSRPDPAAFIERYVALHRTRNVDGLLGLHTAEAEFLIPGQPPIRGTIALRNLFEWDAVLESELVMSAINSNGDTIFVDSVTERNKWFQAMGLAEVRYQPGTKIVLRDGQIIGTYPATFDEATLRQFTRVFERLMQWLATQRPEALAQLLPEGRFKYDAASARLWLEVLAEWNAAAH